jgi:integrase
MVRLAPKNLTGLRDRALLLLGFAGALRRSELVGLDVSDLIKTNAGLRIRIRTSKTDQERLGQITAIARGKGYSTSPIDYA